MINYWQRIQVDQETSPWHSVTVASTLNDLQSSTEGLDQHEAEARLATHGANCLPEAPKRSVLLRFVSHFHHLLIYVLIGAALMTAVLGHWIDTGVILAVVLANALIGFIQEGKAEKAMDAIRHMLALHANVIRGGQRIRIEGEKLVPGDIVLLEAGDKVPADLRLLSAHGLSVQEAILTGESVPVDKGIDAVARDATLGDRTGMAFSGTLVARGQGRGVVVATGRQTEIGRISGLLSQVEQLTTPLVQQMNVFARWLTLVILAIAALLLTFGYFIEYYEFSEIFVAVVGLSVAAIPEGLPAVLTITLAIGVQSMARRNAIVRRLPAIETLGSVSVICSDKTGTLTRNEMMVATVLDHQHLFTVNGDGYSPQGALQLDGTDTAPSDHKVLIEIGKACALCNDAELHQEQGTWVVEGDPMEGALLAFASKMTLDLSKERSLWVRTYAIPFDARHRFMATLNHNHEGLACVFVKGAPERLLEMCQDQRTALGDSEPLDADYWERKSQDIAAEGQRVLGIAVKSVDPQQSVLAHEDVEGSLTFLGLVGMIDPPRPEALSAVAECHQAGIHVKMITGDHASTAAAIGRQIGLNNPGIVLTGADLDKMDDHALRESVLNCNVFARTSPEHKLRLVTALQAHGMAVAMTGDGVNDAPALKRADAGIAMGKKGSEAAREAAELVLADDNFASIVDAVRHGRTVYDNLTKVISFMLPINGGESASLIVALLIGLTLPISPVQILWVNMIGSTILAMTLAFEPPEPQIMRKPPRPMNKPLLSGFLVWRVLFVSTLFAAGIFGQFYLALTMGKDLETARTIAVNTLIAMEVFYLFSIRYVYGTSLTWRGVAGTPPVLIALGLVVVAQLLFIYTPVMQTIFATASLSLVELFFIVGSGVVLFFIMELEKRLRLGSVHS